MTDSRRGKGTDCRSPLTAGLRKSHANRSQLSADGRSLKKKDEPNVISCCRKTPEKLGISSLSGFFKAEFHVKTQCGRGANEENGPEAAGRMCPQPPRRTAERSGSAASRVRAFRMSLSRGNRAFTPRPEPPQAEMKNMKGLSKPPQNAFRMQGNSCAFRS